MDINYYKQFEPIDGKWYITKELGSGAFGTVFEVERRDFSQAKSALKVITIPSSPNEVNSYREDNYDLDEKSISSYFYGFVEEFTDEFKLMTKLRGNSNIVSIEDYDVIEHKDEIGWDIFIRMELLTPMNKYFRDHELSQRDIIKLGIDICKALEICQKYKIIHRDIKPSNIFVSDTGEFKLGDFGIARTLEKTSSGLSKKGTYTYMAPEVHIGGEYGSNVDIYSLGIVMYKLLNNNFEPFRTKRTHNDEEEAITRRLKGEKVPKPANADGRLAEIILKACSFNPKERYESPLRMREELENIIYNDSDVKVIYPDGDEVDYEPSTASVLGNDDSKSEETIGIFDSCEIGEENQTVSLFDDKKEKNESNNEVNKKVKKQDIKKKGIDSKKNNKSIGKIIEIVASILVVVTLGIWLFAKINAVEVTGISNIPNGIEMLYGEQLQLEPEILPKNAKCDVKYSLDNTNVATVDENGLLTAKSKSGSATLYIKAGKYVMTQTINVVQPKDVDAIALEKKYKELKELYETVTNDTEINHDHVKEEIKGAQYILKSLEIRNISIDDISEQKPVVLSELLDISLIQSYIKRLNDAYEKAKELAQTASKTSENIGTAKKTQQTMQQQPKQQQSTQQQSQPQQPTQQQQSQTVCPVCGSKYHIVHPSSEAPEINKDFD